MHLQINFSFLLTTVLLLSSFNEGALAAPQAKRKPQMVTMPLRSLHKRGSDVHSHIFMQQHINRSNKRLARMTGRQAPSDLEMRAALQRRVNAVHLGFAAGKHTHSKRYVIKGISEVESGFDFLAELAKERKGGRKKGTAAAAAAAGGAGLGAGAAAAAGETGSSSAATPTGSVVAGSNSTSSSNSQGVSSIDIQAAQNGGLTQANTPTANNSIALNIEADDVGYIGQLQIGTPPQNFLALMDSGSADFWVGAENCQSENGGGCGNHTLLGTNSSSSFKDTNKQFQVTYGTGNVAGDIVTDDVVFAGLPLNTHTFGVATQESVDFSDDSVPFDGLVGLAQSTLSEQKTDTPVESLAKAGTIPATISSFKISRLSDQKNDGEVTFGGLDTTKFDQSTLVEVPNVNTQGFFEAAMIPTVNGQSVGLDQGRTAILDTGTTLIVAPQQDADAVHQAIQGAQSDGQGGFTVPCTMSDTVSLAFGNQTFDINPSDIAFLPVDPQNPTGDCQSGIQAGNVGGATEWLVGDVFLKNAYFSANTDKNTVSLAKLV